MLTLHTEAELNALLTALDPDGNGTIDPSWANGYRNFTIGAPTDDTWQGALASAIAGESLSTANRWAPLYCKDTGTGTRFYLYDADASDANSYSPIALLYSNGTYVAGNTIQVTLGDGILANDTWSAAASEVGKALYCTTTPGGVSATAPTGSGRHVKQIGTLLNIAANGRDVWEISFRYPDVVIP